MIDAADVGVTGSESVVATQQVVVCGNLAWKSSQGLDKTDG